MGKLYYALSNNQWIKEEITREIKYLETNENEHTIYQNVLDAMKAVLRGKFIAVNAYIKKKRTSLVAQWLRVHLPVQGTWV